MLPRQKVVWVEGMMIEPQHFQQLERYFENLLNKRVNGVDVFDWGFLELEIDYSLLEQDKLAIKKAKGIFPDGTPFDMPSHDPLPPPIEFVKREEYQGEVVCLSLSMDILGNPYTDLTKQKSNARYSVVESEIVDRNFGIFQEGNTQLTQIQIASLKTRLGLKKNVSSAETTIPICKIQEFTQDGKTVLDDNFIPPLLDFKAFGWLKSSVNELLGIISSRVTNVRENYFDRSVGSLTELLELLLLQIFNEYKFKLSHLLSIPKVHPERLFFVLLEMLGKISFVPGAERFAIIKHINYDHEALHVSFLQLINALRNALSLIIEAPSVALQFIDRGDGIYVYQNDPQLRLEKIVFAVSADIPSDRLKVNFPAQTKIGPSEMIASLIELQLPGIRLLPLATPPRYIPYYPSSIYFEMDNQDPIYKKALSSASIAMSVVGDFQSLRFDVWGIKEGRVK